MRRMNQVRPLLKISSSARRTLNVYGHKGYDTSRRVDFFCDVGQALRDELSLHLLSSNVDLHTRLHVEDAAVCLRLK